MKILRRSNICIRAQVRVSCFVRYDLRERAWKGGVSVIRRLVLVLATLAIMAGTLHGAHGIRFSDFRGVGGWEW